MSDTANTKARPVDVLLCLQYTLIKYVWIGYNIKTGKG
jgi:hypothetical protein